VSGATYRIASHVQYTVIDGTAILMDSRGEKYLGLNELGTRIFEWIGGGGDVEQLVDGLREEYRVTEDVLRRDIDRMIRQLEEAGLIERARPDRT
jgi:coenzyme PQQ synthesis protein D (PqqD)